MTKLQELQKKCSMASFWAATAIVFLTFLQLSRKRAGIGDWTRFGLLGSGMMVCVAFLGSMGAYVPYVIAGAFALWIPNLLMVELQVELEDREQKCSLRRILVGLGISILISRICSLLI